MPWGEGASLFDIAVLSIMFFLMFIGLVDVICEFILWRWHYVKKKSARLAFERATTKRSPTSIWGEKTQEHIFVPGTTQEEMDRYYGAPW